MNKVINGRRYDTETARELASASSAEGRSDFHWWEETLYRKSTGEYFLYGEGGPASRYAQASGQNSWSGGCRIMPMSLQDAQAWAEKHLDAEDYEEIFGAINETVEKRNVTFSLTGAAIEKITQMALAQNITKSEVIEQLLM